VRHAVLGGGGVGGFIAGVLARSGADVLLLVRSQSLATYSGSLRVESVVLGDFTVAVPVAERLVDEVDVVWVATKAMQLEDAVAVVSPEVVREGWWCRC
jgi:ketopantoate reductase